MTTRKNMRHRKEQRRVEAAQRQEARDARSDELQLRMLSLAGHGHCKEADRLRKRIWVKNGGKLADGEVLT